MKVLMMSKVGTCLAPRDSPPCPAVQLAWASLQPGLRAECPSGTGGGSSHARMDVRSREGKGRQERGRQEREGTAPIPGREGEQGTEQLFPLSRLQLLPRQQGAKGHGRQCQQGGAGQAQASSSWCQLELLLPGRNAAPATALPRGRTATGRQEPAWTQCRQQGCTSVRPLGSPPGRGPSLQPGCSVLALCQAEGKALPTQSEPGWEADLFLIQFGPICTGQMAL